MPRLPFITFEGSEGCGKSTQVQRLAARLDSSGVPYLVTREPGGTPIGETIRELLQFAPHNSSMTPETELLLFEASRSQLVRETIKPAIERGACVIADRFFDSTTVYQGAARNLDSEMVERLNAFTVADCVPDITFVLDVDAATAESRMQKPRRPDIRNPQKLLGQPRCPIRRLEMPFSRTTALEYLRRAHQQSRLAHAYLITGPPGSGKRLLAADLASLVNSTPAGDVFSAKAREIFVARPESKSRRIVIEQVRDLEHALQMRASNGRRKVAIIFDADRLQPQAANAFLKTLEEPPRDSLLLLLSALPEALPETILSRCIAIPLASDGEARSKKEEEKLVKLLQQASRQTNWSVQFA